MPSIHDGPHSPLFEPLVFKGNTTLKGLAGVDIPEKMKENLAHAPSGACTCWGLPFEVGRVACIKDTPLSVTTAPTKAQWLVFMHTTAPEPLEWNEHGVISPTRGAGRLKEQVADYVICYADGSEARAAIRRRFEVGMASRGWGENCFAAVGCRKPHPVPAHHEQPDSPICLGASRRRGRAILISSLGRIGSGPGRIPIRARLLRDSASSRRANGCWSSALRRARHRLCRFAGSGGGRPCSACPRARHSILRSIPGGN